MKWKSSSKLRVCQTRRMWKTHKLREFVKCILSNCIAKSTLWSDHLHVAKAPLPNCQVHFTLWTTLWPSCCPLIKKIMGWPMLEFVSAETSEKIHCALFTFIYYLHAAYACPPPPPKSHQQNFIHGKFTNDISWIFIFHPWNLDF